MQVGTALLKPIKGEQLALQNVDDFATQRPVPKVGALENQISIWGRGEYGQNIQCEVIVIILVSVR